jgi:tetratricopeptide (TPR) repeat protein
MGGAPLWVRLNPFRLLFGLGRATGQQVGSWWETRSLRYLLQGLPALTVAIAVLVVAAMVFFQDRAAVAQEYKNLGNAALGNAQYRAKIGAESNTLLAVAHTCFSRLSMMGDSDPDNTFQLARTFDLERQHAAAAILYKKLAPTDDKGYIKGQKGYGPADFMVAMRLLAMPGVNGKPEVILQAEQHLVRAVDYKVEPYSSYARVELYNLYRGQNRPEAAEDELATAVRILGDQQPDWRVELAKWYEQTSKRDLAERQIELAIIAYDKKYAESRTDHQNNFKLLQCLTWSGIIKCAKGDFTKGKTDFARAGRICEDGFRLNDPKSKEAAAYADLRQRMLISAYDSLANDPNTPAAERFGMLDSAAKINPFDGMLLQKLIKFIRADGPEGERTRQVFRELEDTGERSAIAHMILGEDCYEREKFADARHHWEKAYEYAKGAMPHVANNLAWVLSFQEPIELNKALGLVEAAISQSDTPLYHGTRGQILVKMHRYSDALPELERAKVLFGNDPRQGPQLFKALAETYENLGLTDEAARAKKRAEELAKKAPKGTAPAGPSVEQKEKPATGATPTASTTPMSGSNQ